MGFCVFSIVKDGRYFRKLPSEWRRYRCFCTIPSSLQYRGLSAAAVLIIFGQFSYYANRVHLLWESIYLLIYSTVKGKSTKTHCLRFLAFAGEFASIILFKDQVESVVLFDKSLVNKRNHKGFNFSLWKQIFLLEVDR